MNRYESNFDNGIYRSSPTWNGRSVKGSSQSAAMLTEADTDK